MTTTEEADIFPELSDDKVNKAIVDYTSPALCTPVTPSRRYAMQPIVNVPEEDRATDIRNMRKKLVKIARVVPEIS